MQTESNHPATEPAISRGYDPYNHLAVEAPRSLAARCVPLPVTRIRLAGVTFAVADGGDVPADFLEQVRGYGLEAYRDCNGTLCLRSVAEGDAHRARVRSEREDRDAANRRHERRIARELLAARIARNECIRDTTCLRRIGHNGRCVHDVRTLKALGEGRGS